VSPGKRLGRHRRDPSIVAPADFWDSFME